MSLYTEGEIGKVVNIYFYFLEMCSECHFSIFIYYAITNVSVYTHTFDSCIYEEVQLQHSGFISRRRSIDSKMSLKPKATKPEKQHKHGLDVSTI